MTAEDLVITIDIDWAPDFAIETLAGILRGQRVKATWFVTHESPAIDALAAEPELFELGIHPNLLPGSTHGASIGEALDHVMALVPDAVSMRAHSIFQCGPLLDEVVRRTPVRIDSSIFVPNLAHVQPVAHLTPSGPLTRIPFIWMDYHETMRATPDWTDRCARMPGVKDFAFHPMHVVLNSTTYERYVDFKTKGPHFQQASASTCVPWRQEGDGAGAMFRRLVDLAAGQGGGSRLRDVPT
jgi:hypothetical protein